MKLDRWFPWCALAALAVFPLLAPAMGLDFYVNFVRRALIFALAAASLNFILGFGGMAALVTRFFSPVGSVGKGGRT